MKQLYLWCSSNITFLFTLFLLAFIPLYPKLPLVDIHNTWVYVRIEDFVVLFALLSWIVLIIRNKINIRTPITIPILLFWFIGVIATVHGVLLIFPSIPHVYPNIAFLSLLRRIEYMSLFFIAYGAMKDKRFIRPVVFVLILTLIGVIAYGFGQRYFGFYAFLTMNEEFAKGIPIQLSQLSRISSTFSGHYDLAGYLVLMIPILVSLMFGIANKFVKGFLLAVTAAGFVLLFLTVSRISFAALFLALGVVLLLQRKKFIMVTVPVIILFTLLLVGFFPGLLNRFDSTLKEIDVLVNADTGVVVGHTSEVDNAYVANKVIRQQFKTSIHELDYSASPSSEIILSSVNFPQKVVLLTDPKAPTGEDLPQGTGYINLPLSPIKRKIGSFIYEPKNYPEFHEKDVFVINGNYVLKKALTYDLSFTTRFQGEWPRAIETFKNNIFLGSGYGSVGLAVDNSYLRMLAEIGFFGFSSFLVIFICFALYIRSVMPFVDSPLIKSFVIGVSAGLAGLALNALFIDVFEASKIAFVAWLLIGVVLGILRLYEQTPVNLSQKLRQVATSTSAVIVFLLLVTIVLYSQMVRNNFVGDDFTWFRWAADCGKNEIVSQRCPPNISTIIGYFVRADGFFYRPGAKLYFLFMYWIFWLNQTPYHIVSLLLHFGVSVLVYVLAKKIFKQQLLAFFAGLLFLTISGYSEAVNWVSATGFLFTAFFSLFSLYFYTIWIEKKKIFHFIATIIFFILSLLFHEMGLVTPFFYLLYSYFFGRSLHVRPTYRDSRFKFLFLPVPMYLIVRFIAQSHWFSGDYNYNLFRLPFNALGNAMGYFFLSSVGPFSAPFFTVIRSVLRDHLTLAVVASSISFFFIVYMYKFAVRRFPKDERNVVFFSIAFFIIALLPFLGLGNISSRYSYVSSIGIVFLLVLLVKYMYVFFLRTDRYIAVSSVAIFIGIFSLFQIIQQQKIQHEWLEAGKKSKNFFMEIERLYDDNWTKDPLELHFVNVPIRYGEAWIFPVGLQDALWFIFRNPESKVFTWQTLDQAFDAVRYNAPYQKVFEFDENGLLTERKKLAPTP